MQIRVGMDFKPTKYDGICRGDGNEKTDNFVTGQRPAGSMLGRDLRAEIQSKNANRTEHNEGSMKSNVQTAQGCGGLSPQNWNMKLN